MGTSGAMSAKVDDKGGNGVLGYGTDSDNLAREDVEEFEVAHGFKDRKQVSEEADCTEADLYRGLYDDLVVARSAEDEGQDGGVAQAGSRAYGVGDDDSHILSTSKVAGDAMGRFHPDRLAKNNDWDGEGERSKEKGNGHDTDSPQKERRNGAETSKADKEWDRDGKEGWRENRERDVQPMRSTPLGEQSTEREIKFEGGYKSKDGDGNQDKGSTDQKKELRGGYELKNVYEDQDHGSKDRKIKLEGDYFESRDGHRGHDHGSKDCKIKPEDGYYEAKFQDHVSKDCYESKDAQQVHKINSKDRQLDLEGGHRSKGNLEESYRRGPEPDGDPALMAVAHSHEEREFEGLQKEKAKRKHKKKSREKGDRDERGELSDDSEGGVRYLKETGDKVDVAKGGVEDAIGLVAAFFNKEEARKKHKEKRHLRDDRSDDEDRVRHDDRNERKHETTHAEYGIDAPQGKYSDSHKLSEPPPNSIRERGKEGRREDDYDRNRPTKHRRVADNEAVEVLGSSAREFSGVEGDALLGARTEGRGGERYPEERQRRREWEEVRAGQGANSDYGGSSLRMREKEDEGELRVGHEGPRDGYRSKEGEIDPRNRDVKRRTARDEYIGRGEEDVPIRSDRAAKRGEPVREHALDGSVPGLERGHSRDARAVERSRDGDSIEPEYAPRRGDRPLKRGREGADRVGDVDGGREQRGRFPEDGVKNLRSVDPDTREHSRDAVKAGSERDPYSQREKIAERVPGRSRNHAEDRPRRDRYDERDKDDERLPQPPGDSVAAVGGRDRYSERDGSKDRYSERVREPRDSTGAAWGRERERPGERYPERPRDSRDSAGASGGRDRYGERDRLDDRYPEHVRDSREGSRDRSRTDEGARQDGNYSERARGVSTAGSERARYNNREERGRDYGGSDRDRYREQKRSGGFDRDPREARDGRRQRDGNDDPRRDRRPGSREIRSSRSPSRAGDGEEGKKPEVKKSSADVVRAMMSAPGKAPPVIAQPSLPLTNEDKKKLLWGKKKEEVAQAPVEAFGFNRWDTAEFTNEEERIKFQKLMGVKAPATVNRPFAPPSPTCKAMSKDEAERVLHDVEEMYMKGMRRADGRTVGLGL